MERDDAERVAASMVDGVTVDQARLIIRTFLEQLVRCPVCDGGGRITFRRDVGIDLSSHGSAPLVIPAGTSASCPFCDGKGDSAWVGWRCHRGGSERDCRYDKQGDAERRDSHTGCGWRIMIPYDTALPPANRPVAVRGGSSIARRESRS